jgi:hypothetical protein
MFGRNFLLGLALGWAFLANAQGPYHRGGAGRLSAGTPRWVVQPERAPDLPVRPRELREGGPPMDGIPALVEPAFLSALDARRFLRPKDRVVGVEIAGDARAYPIRILNWHELVNDTVGGQALLVTW